MGNFGSALSTDGDELQLHHPVVAAHLEALRSAAARLPPSSSGGHDDPEASQAPPTPTPSPPPHSLFRYYVDACRSFGACGGMSDDRDGNHVSATDWFRNQCQDVAPTIHRMFRRRGQRRFVHNGVFYYVLVTREEVQLFTRHMKGLEVVQFLRLPDVVAPESALTQFLGMQVACLRMLHLHTPISNKDSSAAYHSDPPTGSAVPRHAAVAKMILGRVLRASTDAPTTMYEIGDGRLAVTDASCLLPSLCASIGSLDRNECTIRAELLIGRDLGAMTVSLPVHSNMTSEVMPRVVYAAAAADFADVAGVCESSEAQKPLGIAIEPQVTGNGFPTISYLEFVAASAAGKKKQLSIPVLNALVALSCNGTHCLSDRLSVAGTPIALQPVHVAQQDTVVVRQASRCDGGEQYGSAVAECRFRQLHHNAVVTSHILLRVLPTLVAVLESLPDDMDAKEFSALLHLAGVNVCLFGYLHYILQQRPSSSELLTARSLLRIEMVSRAGKRWLLRRMVAAGPEVFGELTLTLLRGINEPTFFDSEIVPCLWEVFGATSEGEPQRALPPPFCSVPCYGEASFKACMERLRDLTGVTVAQGRVCGAVPVVRLARRNFTLSVSDEQSVCNVAARRQDGIAGAALFAAASWWATNPNRLAKIVDQLQQRVAAAAAQPPSGAPASDGMLTTQLFFTELQFLLSRLVLLRLVRERGDASRYDAEMRRRFDYIDGVLSAFVPSMAQLFRTTPHDRLHLCREVLPLIEFKLKEPSTAGSGIQLLRILLQLGVLSDTTHYHPVSSRGLADELYRVSIETCLLSKQCEEAIAVAHRWARLCPSLFGVFSKQNCRATKLLLSSLIIGRCNKSEQLRMAQHQLHLCETVFGSQDIKTAAALSELGSLTWKSSPALGLRHFRRSMEIYREVLGPTCRPVCSALYNIGLALARLNRFGSAMSHLAAARSMAAQLHEHATVQMCEVSERTLRGVAALKIQRWYREYKYGQAQSQTTRSQTDITTLCSTLSWSDEHDEISSSVND